MPIRNIDVFKVHSWAGIIAGIGLLIISLSGSILCFKHVLEEVLHPELYNAKYLSAPLASDMYAELNKQYPEWCVTTLYLPQEKKQVYRAHLINRNNADNKRKVYLDPQTMKWQVMKHDPINFAEDLHYYLLLPRYPGLIVTFIFSIGLCVAVVSGAYIYRKKLLQILSLKFKNLKNWHNSIGMLSLFFNALMATTALLITLSGVIGGPRGSSFYQTNLPKSFDLNMLEVEAKKANPDKYEPIKNISFLSGRTMFHFQHNDGKNGALGAYHRVFLHPETGKVLSVGGKNETHLMRALNSSVSFHFGDFSGLVLNIIYSIGGILISILTISGGMIWLKRTRGEMKPKKSKKEQANFEYKFSRYFKKGFKAFGLLLPFMIGGGAAWGIFAGNIVLSALYFTTLLLFPLILNYIIILILWVPIGTVMLVKKTKAYKFRIYNAASTALFAGALIWYLLMWYLKF
ncbi:PepSY-associated TM helix domain-containing protein [Sporocytophaga myxococcoides]|uniref:PepSY-associated TM helix domain-containing protein n=1 Tax=Sporocytophaga myxococcoides TaxID=153721 RepID=UPI00040FAC0C|nr:PepSY-associated TM helix domain-containing protein [Sporocytophaga myxococcoides]